MAAAPHAAAQSHERRVVVGIRAIHARGITGIIDGAAGRVRVRHTARSDRIRRRCLISAGTQNERDENDEIGVGATHDIAI
jgi:hypothetical protein